jgi:hypothetical protein
MFLQFTAPKNMSPKLISLVLLLKNLHCERLREYVTQMFRLIIYRRFGLHLDFWSFV